MAMLKVKTFSEIQRELSDVLNYVEDEIIGKGEDGVDLADMWLRIHQFFYYIFHDCKQALFMRYGFLSLKLEHTFIIELGNNSIKPINYICHCPNFYPEHYFMAFDEAKYPLNHYGVCDAVRLMRHVYLELFDEHYLERTCPHCGKNVTLSKIIGYSYQCKDCDEDFHIFECEPIVKEPRPEDDAE